MIPDQVYTQFEEWFKCGGWSENHKENMFAAWCAGIEWSRRCTERQIIEVAVDDLSPEAATELVAKIASEMREDQSKKKSGK